MFSELLLGIFLQTSINSKINTSFFDIPDIKIERPETPKKPSRFRNSSPTPTPTPSVTPKSTPTSTPTSTPKPSSTTQPVAQSVQLTTQTILKASNDYRSKNGAGALQIDSKLQSYAQDRANYLKSLGKLDNHAKHKEFMNNDGFNKLGFNSIGENQGYNYKGDAKGLIESFYGKSSGHNKNQLNSTYTHVGIGINGPFTNLVFGGKKK